jgi:uncharacterized membrane protein YbhN (UPF0104 family)
LTAEHGANNGATNIFENLFRQHETNIITNLIFEILSCILSCFLGFSANSFLCFHFVFQKTAPFKTLLTTIYQVIGKICILKIVENSTKQPR